MRAFMDSSGRFYKAEEPVSPADMEKPVISAEAMETLSNVPMTQADWDEKIRLFLVGGTAVA